MALTAQQLIEISRERERLFKEVGGKVREERAVERKEKVGRFVKRAEAMRLPRLRTPTRIPYKKSRRVGRAVTGLLSALVPQEAMAGAVSYVDKKGDRGRGRPHGTYKKRYLPDGRIVQVPTHIYRRMLSEYKAKRRLAEAQRQAKMQEQYEAEQIAMQQDPRYQPSGDEQFLEGDDMEHEQRVAGIKERMLYQQQAQVLRRQQAAQQAGQQPRTGFATKAKAMFGRLGGGLWGPQSQQFPSQGQATPQGAEPYGARHVQSILRPINPQVVVTSGKSIMFAKSSNLLNQKNEFNRPADSVLEQGGVRRKW